MQAVSLIGFGEAGSTFAKAGGWGEAAYVFDVKDKQADYRATGVNGCSTLADAINRATIILSLVTADQALNAAQNAALCIGRSAYYLDMNSVAPQTKKAAAELISNVGASYIDVAIMAPVYPAQLSVPLLLSGPDADHGAQLLAALGFGNVRVVSGEIGKASAIKMIRSIMVKGIEALTAEVMLAADKAGVTAEVLQSLGADWSDKAEYNLERMTTHGVRRAQEMQEVALMLEAMGVEPLMTKGTIIRQQQMAHKEGLSA